MADGTPADTLLLDVVEWDLVLDAHDNIAVASPPYSLAQDAASEIRTWSGEVFWDVLIGVPYITQILAKRPSLALLKARFQAAAESVPGVSSAKVLIASVVGRIVAGQVQVTSAQTGQTAAANFTSVDPMVA